MKHQRSLYAKQNLCESSAASDPIRSCCTPRSSFSCLSSPQPMQSICVCLYGRGCALTVLCRTTLEQNPLQDLPAGPVGHSDCSPVGQPSRSLGMTALCALGCLSCSRAHGTGCFYPSLPYRVNIRWRGHGKGLSWESSDATRHGWQIYRQLQITVNAGYRKKAQHNHHELGQPLLGTGTAGVMGWGISSP